MQRTAQTLFLLALLASATTSARPSAVSEARCKASLANTACELEWDFSAVPRMHYTVERLDPDTGRWQAVHRADAMRLTGSETLSGGALHRVRGCNSPEPGVLDSCVSSDVVWSPVHVGKNQIPPEVVGADGVVMSVDKSASVEEQLEQYNVYLLVRLLGNGRVDLARLPAMTEVSERELWIDGEWSPAQAMQRSLFLNYSGMQRIARERVNGQGALP